MTAAQCFEPAPPCKLSTNSHAASAKRDSPDRILKSKGSRRQAATEDHQAIPLWSVALNNPQPSGEGSETFNFARSNRSLEQENKLGDMISKKVCSTSVSYAARKEHKC